MKIVKNCILALVLCIATLFTTYLALNAWDNTMTDEEIMYYLEKYPTEEKLIKLAEQRNLIEKTE